MPAKLDPNKANEFITQIAQEKGITFLSKYAGSTVPIRFLCKECGQETKITWGQLKAGKNPQMVCVDCSYKYRAKTPSLSYADLKADIEAKGSILLTEETEKLNTHTELSLICTYCGDEFKLRYGDYKRGRCPNLRCPQCAHIVNGNHIEREKNRVSHEITKQMNYTEIKDIVESTGAKLLTTIDEYVDKGSNIRFSCSNCGKEYHIRWQKFVAGQNPNLLCSDCLPEKNEYTTEMVKADFAEHGVELLNDYKNISMPLLFKCKQCGELTSNTWGRYHYLGRNREFLCKTCRKGLYSTDPNSIVGTYYSENGVKRNKAESRAREFCKTFYNLGRDIRGEYEAHHIKPLKLFPNLQYSLGNLYPLPKVEHHTNNFTYYHYLEESRNPENWDSNACLPYHNYDGFKFFDLNKYLITDFILEENPNLFDVKKDYEEKGIVYIPFYFQEMDVFQKAFISYSMIRSRLAKVSEIGMSIYPYTGQKFYRYNTRELEVRRVTTDEAFYFFNSNHIQGYVDCSVCIGLYSGEKLVSAMAFGTPRGEKWLGENHYELLRFCSYLNSSVPGAASKLFKHFIEKVNPELIVTFCDVRFSSTDPEKTIYAKLGFGYDGYSKPNYKYAKDGELFSRQQFMKNRLSKKLEKFDPALTEAENMRMNGYTKLYDCGNFRYVWRKSNNSQTV